MFYIGLFREQESFCSPLAQSKYFENNCIIANDMIYLNDMFGQGWGGGGLSKKPKTYKWAQLLH